MPWEQPKKCQKAKKKKKKKDEHKEQQKDKPKDVFKKGLQNQNVGQEGKKI